MMGRNETRSMQEQQGKLAGWRDLKRAVSQWQVAGSSSFDQRRTATANWLLTGGSAYLGAWGKTERKNARMRGMQRSPEHR